MKVEKFVEIVGADFFHERNGAPARGAPCIENMH